MKTMTRYLPQIVKEFASVEQVAIDENIEVCNHRSAAKWRGGDNPEMVSYDPYENLFYDFKTKEGGDVIKLFQYIHNCDFVTAVNALGDRYCPHMQQKKAGKGHSAVYSHPLPKPITDNPSPESIPLEQLSQNPALATAWPPVNIPNPWEVVQSLIDNGYQLTRHFYKDADGQIRYEIQRYTKPECGKIIKQRRKEPDGKWIWKGPIDDERLLYNLPEVLKPENTTIYLNEGEKCADACIAHGLCGTTSGNCDSWLKRFADDLRGKHVVILRDYDSNGVIYALSAALDLLGVASSVKVLSTWQEKESGVKKKTSGDVADWFNHNEDGKALERLLSLVNETPCLKEDDRQKIEMELAMAEAMNAKKKEKKAEEQSVCNTVMPVAVCVSDWLKNPEASSEVILEKLLDSGDCCFVVGPSKIRKTFFTTQLAMSVATGRDFLGFHVPSPRKVLYIQLEVKPFHFQRRLMQMIESMEIKPEELTGLHLVNMRGVDDAYLREDALIRLMDDQKPELTIIDPAYLLLGDESDQGEAKDFVKRLGRMSMRTGSALVAVFHTAKSGSTIGRTAIDAACGSTVFGRFADSQFVLSPHEKGTDYVVLQTVTRHYTSPADCTIRFNAGKFIPDITPAIMARPSQSAKAVDVIDSVKITAWFKEYGEPMNRSTLASCLTAEGVKSKDIELWISKLKAEKLIVEESKHGAKNARLFKVGEEKSQDNPPLVDEEDIPDVDF